MKEFPNLFIDPEEPIFFDAALFLSDTKYIRGRTVYNIITLFSEVSGLADIFFVTATFILGLFFIPLMLEAALLEHMGTCELPKL